MKIFFVLFISSFLFTSVHTQVPVFISGTEGHESYRIPAIIQNNKGKEEKNNSKNSCNILGGASVHKRASYHMNSYIIANGN